MKLKPALFILVVIGSTSFGASRLASRQMGRQSDAAHIVSTGRRIEPATIAFNGRPIDLVLHPSGEFCAVLSHHEVFLVTKSGVIPGSSAALAEGAGFRGLIWNPVGTRLFASISEGYIQEFRLENRRLLSVQRLELRVNPKDANPRPGGMAITRDGSTLFVAALDRNSVIEFDLSTYKRVRELPVQNLPFEVKLSIDESVLIVSNWGGRLKQDGDETSPSGSAAIVCDPRGIPSTGTVSIIHRNSGKTSAIEVGLHPTGLAVDGNRVFVANAASDTVSEIDLSTERVKRTLGVRWGDQRVFGSMPCAISVWNGKLVVCNGGDNAICEIDIATGETLGFRPAGYFPIAVALSGNSALVLNTKGNGSVAAKSNKPPHNAHDFQGSISVIDLTDDIVQSTSRVAANNGWSVNKRYLASSLKVYNGAIKHVLYIIKENRTYDEVFGDMPQGNGDAKLCGVGEQVTPNHHQLARNFTLFDNGYVTGTNSADGHAWCTQALANDYLERFYTGYRTYPDDGDCSMSLASSGAIWEAASKAKKTVRVYGEFADDALARFVPEPKDWLEVWKDRQSGRNLIKTHVATRVASLKPFLHPGVVYWPLLQSDQRRADLFIEEYSKFSKNNIVPNLMILSLPCDHTEGRDPKYPKPKSMIADNDLALGRVVEAVSHSAQWKETCIFVIEDDAQSGPDHVDGHRTVFSAISPYTKRGFVDSNLYTTLSMLRSMEMMLGIGPMNQFDKFTPPMTGCFSDKPDLTPYKAMPNRIRLDDMNPPTTVLRGKELYWTRKSLALDWSGPDRADPTVLNQVLWYSFHGIGSEYPIRTNQVLRTAKREVEKE